MFSDLHSASLQMPLMHSDMDHSVLPANNTISAFTSKHSRGGNTRHARIANAWVQLTTHLSTLRGWMAELAMLTDIQFTMRRSPVNCTSWRRPGKVQARESSSVIEQHSNHCAMSPIWQFFICEKRKKIKKLKKNTLLLGKYRIVNFAIWP